MLKSGLRNPLSQFVFETLDLALSIDDFQVIIDELVHMVRESRYGAQMIDVLRDPQMPASIEMINSRGCMASDLQSGRNQVIDGFLLPWGGTKTHGLEYFKLIADTVHVMLYRCEARSVGAPVEAW